MNIFDGSAISDRAAMNGWKDQADNLAKQVTYLQQENEVLHAKVAKLEISLAAEREACAKVADAYGYHMEKEAFDKGSDAEMEAMISAAKSIATLIRGREK